MTMYKEFIVAIVVNEGVFQDYHSPSTHEAESRY